MTDHVDPRIEAAAVDRISHNHGPEEGEGMACRTHPTGDCVIRALTARAEAAEAKIAAVRRVIETAYIRNEAGNEVVHVDDVKFALAGEHV